MTSTEWCDFSEFQRVIDDTYPHPVAAFRSNDGTYQDRHFAANHAWCKAAVDSGKLAFFIVYAVYEPDGGNWVTTLMNMVGAPHPRLVVMIDVESWSGRIKGDHSADINAGRARIAQWLGDPRRVIGYGNVGDLNGLWPNKGDAQVVVAAYGSNPSYPGKIAHQYTSSGTCAPFGSPIDLNSADGLDTPNLMAALGLQPPTIINTPEDDMPIHIQRQATGDTWTLQPGAYIKHHPDTANGDVAGYLTTGTGGRTDFRPLNDGDLKITLWDQGFPELNGDLSNLPVNGQYHWSPRYQVPAPQQPVTLTDAQMAAFEQAVSASVSAAILSAGVSLPQSQIDAIASSVREKFTAQPLAAAPFGIS